ncbi:MAG: 2,3-diphosphoglycerate-dependent phosphoglycerate mutase [Caulobacteraceae bacterium]
MPTVVLLRHGQSQWNLENRFTGWVDVDLSELGESEARNAGKRLGEADLTFDWVFCSVLTRAIRTANLALGECGQLWVEMEKSWRLNERHYGALTGLNKAEMAKRHGEAQVAIWRRSYDVAPPPLPPGGLYEFRNDRRYAGMTPPQTESLKDTLGRVIPYWTGAIAPALLKGANALVAAHGNSLRAIMKHLFAISDRAIVGLEIPTANPLVLELNEDLQPRAWAYLDADRAQPLPDAK